MELKLPFNKNYGVIRKTYTGGRGDSLIKVGTDVRAWALGFSGVNFCPNIGFWEVNLRGH